MSTVKIIVPWHSQTQIDLFLEKWETRKDDSRLLLMQDKKKSGCAATKNAGITLARAAGIETVIILDDDCFPSTACHTLGELIDRHLAALQPAAASAFQIVTFPRSRGTPYFLPKTMPVAASMGFWTGVGDYDAPAQLILGARRPMTFVQEAIHGRYFPLCGMNLSFRPIEWWPWCQFIDVPRYDDIWMGWLWMREAYRRGFCFNLAGPVVEHSRQSNVWQNLRDEAKHMETNETLWSDIATSPHSDYASLRKLLPV